MTCKTILVCLTTTKNAERLTKAATLLARRHNAHLIALHTLKSLEVYPTVVVDMPASVSAGFVEEQQRQAEEIRDVFERIAGPEDFPSEWRVVQAGSTHPEERMIEHAHAADLVIMGQADPENDRSDQSRVQEQVIKKSGRPVLVVPHTGDFETIGSHALMGWSATREATRAIHDSLTVLETDAQATLLWVSHSNRDTAYLETTAHAMAAGLDRHGIQTTVAHWQNSKISIGDALLNEAYERGCDMIVTGAFGHSSFYDFVIGATTSHLLQHMTAPVLFSR